MKLKSLCLLACVVGPIAAAHADDGKQLCFWIGGPAMLEYKIPNSQFTIAAGVAPILTDNGSSTDQFGNTTSSYTEQIGFAVESFYYSSPEKSGLGLSVRAGSAGGSSYFGPGVYYVSRPKSNVAFRYGACFPVGQNIVHFVPEIAFGFQF